MNQTEEQELISKLVRFYHYNQNPHTHFLVRCKRDGEIRVGATNGTLRAFGLSAKEINNGLKKRLLQEEQIARNGTIITALVFRDSIEVAPDSLLDRIGLYLKKWLRKLKIN